MTIQFTDRPDDLDGDLGGVLDLLITQNPGRRDGVRHVFHDCLRGLEAPAPDDLPELVYRLACHRLRSVQPDVTDSVPSTARSRPR